jgi:type I restriction-modification system DNA methylase subunit
MDAAEYKHVVLGLILLKYISDAFEEQYRKLEAKRAAGADVFVAGHSDAMLAGISGIALG